ncbi:hypothetical protein ACFLX9_01095 [Chloroflexota bacterium]
MPRWIAIGTAPGWDEAKKLSDEMHLPRNWRPDARTTIKTVYVLNDGRSIAECHAPSQESFEAWLQKKGWTVESITPIKNIANVGSIWEIR